MTTDKMPAGWGFAVPKDATPSDEPAAAPQGSGRAWDGPQGWASDYSDADSETIAVFTLGEIHEQLAHYEESGDATHLWRAWLAARSFRNMPPHFMAALAPHFDKLATEVLAGKSDARAMQRENRRWALFHYYNEIRRMDLKKKGHASTITEARIRAANAHGTTEGTLKQWILEHEGRGQRGRQR